MTRIGDFGPIHVPHRGNVLRNVADGALSMIRGISRVGEVIEKMAALQLSSQQQHVLRHMELLGRAALQQRHDQFVLLFHAQHCKAFFEDDRPRCNRTRGGMLLSMSAPSPRNALDPALVALGHAIRSSRKAVGISQEELAHRSKVVAPT